jgi:hypothetical protein
MIRVYDEAGNVIETHGQLAPPLADCPSPATGELFDPCLGCDRYTRLDIASRTVFSFGLLPADTTRHVMSRSVKKGKDAFLVESAMEALGKIGGSAAKAAVRAATQDSSLRVRVKAREILQLLESTD